MSTGAGAFDRGLCVRMYARAEVGGQDFRRKLARYSLPPCRVDFEHVLSEELFGQLVERGVAAAAEVGWRDK